MPIDALLKSTQGKAAVTGLLSGAAGGALASSLTKSKSAKKMLKTGGLLAVGGLAMKAWQMHSANQANNSAEPEPFDYAQQQASNPATEIPAHAAPVYAKPQTPVAHRQTPVAHEQTPVAGGQTPAANGREATLILTAMISAAHADGILTPEEQQKVWNKAVEQNLPAEELATLSEALLNPANFDQVAALTTTMAEKIEVFTASAIVIEQGCDSGEQYLTSLSSALGLPNGLSQALKQQVA